MNALGHQQYLEFLAIAGAEFSPLRPLAQPLHRGGREFWTVEGLWQGTKVVWLANLTKLALTKMRFEALATEVAGTAIWIPAAGCVRESFKTSIYFRSLKSTRRYDRIRNRIFGRGNWAFEGHYHPETGQVIGDQAEAIELIHRPAYSAQLAQHGEAMARLRQLLTAGRCRITEEMLSAHPHLHEVLAAL